MLCAKPSSTAQTPQASSVPCIIALDGWIKVGEKIIPMQAASLEEDAARKTGTQDEGKTIRYRIDRLGIPLIEVATAPVIYSPMEAQEVAFAIGRILRDTGKVMRGLGTIRQDLNVSLPNGALIEIKGVQELDLISTVVEYEVQRQLGLIAIKEELAKRGITPRSLKTRICRCYRHLQRNQKQSHPQSSRQKPKSLGSQTYRLRGVNWARIDA